MTIDGDLLPQYISAQKALLSSLSLKEVLDQAVLQFARLTDATKVAVFLLDNESQAFNLMAAKGYTAANLEEMKVLSFSSKSLLAEIAQTAAPAIATNTESKADMQVIMSDKSHNAQIALPLLSGSVLFGAVLITTDDLSILSYVDFLKDVSDVTAITMTNAISYGKSEYERECLNTLYKTSCTLSNSFYQISEVLRIAADAAVTLGNTPNCAILLYDAHKESLQLAAFKGLDGSSLNEFNMNTRQTVAGICLKNGKTEYIHGERAPFGLPRATNGKPFASVLALPMILDGEPIGVIQVFSTDSHAFSEKQIELLETLAFQVTTALKVAFMHETTASQIIHDTHTCLYNRLYFENSLMKESERSSRHKHEFGLLLINIDHMRQVNEHLGQEKGDEAIKHVAQIIKQTLRDIDIPCRYGSAEFAVILPETSHHNAKEVAERLRQIIRVKEIPAIGTITVSIGVSSYPGNADNPEGLVKAAQQALNIAKYEGRDRVKDAQTGQWELSGPISWEELANKAKLSVINERQSSLESRLIMNSELAAWMTKTPPLVKKKT